MKNMITNLKNKINKGRCLSLIIFRHDTFNILRELKKQKWRIEIHRHQEYGGLHPCHLILRIYKIGLFDYQEYAPNITYCLYLILAKGLEGVL